MAVKMLRVPTEPQWSPLLDKRFDVVSGLLGDGVLGQVEKGGE
jgi:hypothetical protein